jgi:hydroxyacylglutathione hydrolase
MLVTPIPALSDNYMYLIVDQTTNEAAIVDPYDVDAIAKEVETSKVNLTKCLVTHHHMDHAGGTTALHERYNGKVPIHGGDKQRIEKLEVEIGHNSTFSIGNLSVKCLHTPCHTKTHICYFVEDPKTKERAVFTGDTLFIAGCGRFFEGNADDMNNALNVKLAALPDDTKVYCGHEYTLTNLKFAQTVEPNNGDVKKKLEWANAQRNAEKYTVPSTIGDEKKFNPFMRVNEPSIQETTGQKVPVEVMAELRRRKDAFKA